MTGAKGPVFFPSDIRSMLLYRLINSSQTRHADLCGEGQCISGASPCTWWTGGDMCTTLSLEDVPRIDANPGLHPLTMAAGPRCGSASRPPLNAQSVVHHTFLDLATTLVLLGGKGGNPHSQTHRAGPNTPKYFGNPMIRPHSITYKQTNFERCPN